MNIRYSSEERSTEVPPLGWSPERSAWLAAEAPCAAVCRRRMRAAQAGSPGAASGAGLVGDPAPAATPASKRSLTAAAARRSGLKAAERTLLGDIAGACRNTGDHSPPGGTRAVGADGTAGDGSAAAHPRRGDASRRAERYSAGGPQPGNGKTRPRDGTRAELRPAGDQAVGNTRPKDRQAEQRQRGEDQGQRVADRRLVVEAIGELPEDRRADADDDGKHKDLDARRNDVAEHLLGEKRGAAEEAERHQDEARQCRQLELDQADEELDRDDEEADDDDQPGDQQDHDLDEVLEERDIASEARDRGKDRLAGIDADFGEPARLQQLRLAQCSAPSFEPEPGKRVEDDRGEIVEIADDEGEEADVEGLADEAGDYVLVRGHGPEEAGQCDVDRDQHAGEPAHIALQQAETGIDVLGEGPQKTVDDAGAAHRTYRASGVGSA